MKPVLILFMIFCAMFFSAEAQIGNVLKILYGVKTNAVVTDVEEINNNLYFSVVYDTALTTYSYKKNVIIETDKDLNIISYTPILLNKNRFTNRFFISDLFSVKHPISGQTFLGYAYIETEKSAINGFDSVSTNGLGILDLTTSNYYNSGGFFDNYFSPILGTTTFNYIENLFVYNDTLIFISFVKDTMDSPLDLKTIKFLSAFKFDGMGYALVDSLFLDSTRTTSGNHYYSLYKLNGQPNVQIFSKNTSGHITLYEITSLNPLTLSSVFIGSSYLPYHTPTLLDFGVHSITFTADTLWDLVLIGSNTSSTDCYLYKWKKNNNNSLLMMDSTRIGRFNAKSFGGKGQELNYYSSLIDSIIFTMIPYWYFPSISLLYYFENDYRDLLPNDSLSIFTINSVNAFTMQNRWSITLGGDAFYGVRGIKALSDSSCIVYGWRFDVLDTTRTDGDAFVWKISNGIVTSTLGASPGNVATIFPNPTNDVLKITTMKPYSPEIELYSLEGKLLFRKSYGNANDFELDISNLPGGVYLLRFVAEGFVFEEKVIKK